MGAEAQTINPKGTVEIDGAFFGGYVKPENHKADRKDRRLKKNQSGKRMAVVVMREREGRTVTGVFQDESDALDMIQTRVQAGSTIHADEASCWDALHARFAAYRINHSVSFSDEGACTNQAESFFSRLRRAEVGTHHHISGKYLRFYAGEMAWREDYRRTDNGALFGLVAKAALAHGVSKNWKGYWQRNVAK
jgi:hypothetical protein